MTMEILAPAGEWDALTTAVNAGADAVYLGGKAFNARQSAANFDDVNLEKAVDYLHVRARRLYVTLNTLIANDELEEALKYAAFLREIGVDAVIVQDMGLLKLIRETLPDLPVHASTQMTVHDLGGVKFLEELGVRRVVLARELGLDDIHAISSACQAELEVFVHGAICISYSGACLFSSMVGGRSGNRGRCAQPCRLEYELLKDGKQVTDVPGNHLLSPKDLCLIQELPALKKAGVASLKIEGRMKTPNYVGTVVRIYREALERFYDKPEEYHVPVQAMEDLTSVFNRGLTSGYIRKRINREGMSTGRPSNRGQYLGRVLRYDSQTQRAFIELQTELITGDGIEFWVTRGGRCGQLAEDLRLGDRSVASASAGETLSLPVAKPVYPGDRVFRTSSVRIERQFEQTEAGRVPCRALVRAVAGKPMRVTLVDGEGQMGEAVSPKPLEVALKHPLTADILRTQMERLGDTPFFLEDMQYEIVGEPMAPLSLINALRREAAAQLEGQRVQPMKRTAIPWDKIKKALPRPKSVDKSPKGKPRISVYVGTLDGVKAAIDSGADRVYFGGEELSPKSRWTHETLTEAIRRCQAVDVEPVVALPRITRYREQQIITQSCKVVEDTGAAGILVSHPGQAYLAEKNARVPLFANTGFNLFNPASVQLIAERGFSGVTLSPELTLAQVDEIYRSVDPEAFQLELVVHGALELMILEFCPVNAWASKVTLERCDRPCRTGQYEFKDRKGYVFPLLTDQFCRTHLLNAVDLVLAAELGRFRHKNVLLRLELRDREEREILETVALYREALEGQGEREELVEKAKRISGRGMTRGHYFRGVE